MKEYVRGVGIANRARMLPHEGAFLLVEGGEDARLYGSFIDTSSCKIIVAHGKLNVLDALASLRAQDPRIALAIIDADFMILDGNAPSDSDVLLTDLHDLEAMLLTSPALERVLREYSDDRDAKPRESAPRVRERLLELGLPIGLLRWLSHREGRGWLFKDMDFGCFIDDKTLVLAKPKLLDEIQTRSRKGALLPDDIWPRTDALAAMNGDPWHICCGHDLVMLLAIGLRRVWGTHKDAEVSRERIEQSLRLAYTRADFTATRLHAQLRAWEDAHAPYRILAPERALS